MKPLIYATLATFWLSAPALAQPQPQPQVQPQSQIQQQSGAPTAQADLNRPGNLAGSHTDQTGGGDADNPAPHIYKRGEHVSRSYGVFAVVEDWNQFHLAKPPMDSHWVKYGDNYMLVKIDTGLITDIVKAS
jgi:Ni/Co efflux regulator RcnB